MGKGRRGKRVFPRKHASDFINVSQKPKQLVLDNKMPLLNEKGEASDDWFNNHGRVRTTIGPRHQKDVVLDNTWLRSIPPTIGRVHHSYWDKKKHSLVHADPVPRMEIKKLEKQWQSSNGAKWGVDEYHYIKYSEYDGRVLKLFFCASSYYWVEEFGVEGWARRSDEYHSKVQALRVYERGRIIWLHKESMLKT